MNQYVTRLAQFSAGSPLFAQNHPKSSLRNRRILMSSMLIYEALYLLLS